MSKLILFGSGGHFRSVYDSLDKEIYTDIVILDSNKDKWGSSIMGVPILGNTSKLEKLVESGYINAFICVGDNYVREEYGALCELYNINLINIIDSTSIVTSGTMLSNGIFIGKKVIVNTSCRIDQNVVLNTGSIIEHDCTIHNNSFIGPGVILSGGVTINELAFIGAGATINPYINIGRNTVIGSGSVVTKNINENYIAYGNPCREVKFNEKR